MIEVAIDGLLVFAEMLYGVSWIVQGVQDCLAWGIDLLLAWLQIENDES